MRLPSAMLTPEDNRIWLDVRRALSRRWGLVPHAYIQDFAAGQDRRDADMMHWIERQAGFARRHEVRYGRGKRSRAFHPLARIGMSDD